VSLSVRISLSLQTLLMSICHFISAWEPTFIWSTVFYYLSTLQNEGSVPAARHDSANRVDDLPDASCILARCFARVLRTQARLGCASAAHIGCASVSTRCVFKAHALRNGNFQVAPPCCSLSCLTHRSVICNVTHPPTTSG
jgi:hypothetical protein